MNTLQTIDDTALINQAILDELHMKRTMLLQFVKNQMREGVDYGAIPGTDGKTLLKPGAEKICGLLGFKPQFRIDTDLTMTDFDRGVFLYAFRCIILTRKGEPLIEVTASANSNEPKFKRRISVPEWKATDEQKTWPYVTREGSKGPYKLYQQEDENAAWQNVDNLMAIAQKRAFIRAVTIVACVSELFDKFDDEYDAFITGGANKDELLAENDQLLALKGWTPQRGAAYLQQQYGVRSRRQLSLTKLVEFNEFLEGLSDAGTQAPKPGQPQEPPAPSPAPSQPQKKPAPKMLEEMDLQIKILCQAVGCSITDMSSLCQSDIGCSLDALDDVAFIQLRQSALCQWAEMHRQDINPLEAWKEFAASGDLPESTLLLFEKWKGFVLARAIAQ